mmetsp:Transcript_22524/g.39918  ORF Transcript_22524/g.39918 Transcript_22524/m.39918 type:complete len:480 (-) Transcript_22524:97-1536(-)
MASECAVALEALEISKDLLNCTNDAVFNTSLVEYIQGKNISVTGAGTSLTGCLDACEIEECNDDGETSVVDLLYTVFIQVFVFMLVFGLAGSVDYDAFKERFKSKGVYVGLSCQFVLMPLIGFATVAAFESTLEPLYAVVLLIICASPGGSYSNWWCNLINADLALSVAMTTVSTIVSIGILPLNIFLYIEFGYKALNPDNAQEIVKILPYATIGYTLAVVVCAVVSGLWFGYTYPQHMKRANAMGTTAGFISILMGVVASSTSCAQPWEQPILLYVAVAVPVIIGLFAAMFCASLAKLPKPQRVAVSIETAYQNTGVALAVSLSLGPEGRAAAVVPVVYGGYEALFFGMFALFSWYIGWTLSPEDESLCKILLNDYQDQIRTHPEYANYNQKPYHLDETHKHTLGSFNEAEEDKKSSSSSSGQEDHVVIEDSKLPDDRSDSGDFSEHSLEDNVPDEEVPPPPSSSPPVSSMPPNQPSI